jgi:ankyrin repeat protein
VAAEFGFESVFDVLLAAKANVSALNTVSISPNFFSTANITTPEQTNGTSFSGCEWSCQDCGNSYYSKVQRECKRPRMWFYYMLYMATLSQLIYPPNQDGRTPLQMAAENKRGAVVKKLLSTKSIPALNMVRVI